MSNENLLAYCELLSSKIADMFNVPKEDAVRAVNDPAIQSIFEDYPEYIDQVPLSEWAKDIYYLFIFNPVHAEFDEDMKRIVDALNEIGNVNPIPA